MYEVRKDCKCLNGQNVETFSRTVRESEAGLQIEVGTNGFSGDNSRVYLKLVNCGQNNFMVRCVKDERNKPVGIELAFDGENAFATLMKAIDFSIDVICDQTEEPARRCRH